jgi:membrane protein
MVSSMLERGKRILKGAVADFLATDAPSRGAAIAFYTVTSFVPVLTIAIAIAGFFFGEEAARGAIVAQLRGLLGRDGAELLQNAIESGSEVTSGTIATILGIATLIATSSGVFVELRNGLNAIWKTEPRGETLSRFLRARAASLGLVAALGVILMISLVADAGITAFNDTINYYLPFGAVLLSVINFVVAFLLVALLFAAIFKILPEKPLGWRDVITGALATSFLFQVGKIAIGAYLGSGGVGSSFGAAGALIGLLFWIYYSAQIILLGAAFTKAALAVEGDPRATTPGKKNAHLGRQPAHRH